MNLDEKIAHAEAYLNQHIQLREQYRAESEKHNAEGLRWEGRLQALRELADELTHEHQPATAEDEAAEASPTPEPAQA